MDATDPADGPGAGETLLLPGRSEFSFRDGVIAGIA